MARKQVLVQFDDEMLAELDAEARQEDVNRSEAIRRAVRDYIRDRREARADQRAAEAYRRMPETEEERLEQAAYSHMASEIDLPYDE